MRRTSLASLYVASVYFTIKYYLEIGDFSPRAAGHLRRRHHHRLPLRCSVSGEHFISRPFGCHLLITDATPSAPVALSESAEATIKSCRVSRCLCTTSSLSGDKCAFYTARAVRFCSLMSWLTGNHSSLPPRCFDVPYSFMFTEATNGMLCAYVRKVRVWSVWSAGEHASFISPFDLGAGDTPTSESAIYRTGLIPL